MNRANGGADLPSGVRQLLHDVNNELSVTMLELELLLEGDGLDETSGKAVAGSLEACRRAASSLREVWRTLEGPRDAD